MRRKTISDWQNIATDPQARSHALREYALHVFGNPEKTTLWLNRSNRAIRGGASPEEASRTPEGFFEAMAELARVDLFEQRERLKRAQLAEWAHKRPRTLDVERAA